MTTSPDLLAVLREAFEAGYSQGHDATVEGRYSDPSEAASDYLADCSALSAHEAQGWRPIDEAPKDGTEMFVVGKLGWHAADAVTAYFDDRGRGCWRDRHGDRLEWEPEYFHTLNLPEPPK